MAALRFAIFDSTPSVAVQLTELHVKVTHLTYIAKQDKKRLKDVKRNTKLLNAISMDTFNNKSEDLPINQ